jgi:hypothetical protein
MKHLEYLFWKTKFNNILYNLQLHSKERVKFSPQRRNTEKDRIKKEYR